MCNNFSTVLFTLAACALLIVGCGQGGNIDCQSRGADWGNVSISQLPSMPNRSCRRRGFLRWRGLRQRTLPWRSFARVC
jgi:hypothetical protein